MACKLAAGPVVKSALGAMMGRRMRAFECKTHGEKFSTSEARPVFCGKGYAADCASDGHKRADRPGRFSCPRCGSRLR